MSKFFSWENRPVFVYDGDDHGYVLLEPTSVWTRVDFDELASAKSIETADEFRAMFEPTFGKFETRPAPPRPRMNSRVALAFGRTFRKMGEKYDEPDRAEYGKALEEQAISAIRAGLTKLPPLN